MSGQLLDWPLIPLHAVLLGDGRLLTYGTDADGNQTGYFIYDVWTLPAWDPSNPTLTGSHSTLANTTATDIFCSAQIVLPQSGTNPKNLEVLIAGGDVYNGSPTPPRTYNKGNKQSNIFHPGTPSSTAGSGTSTDNLYAGQNMNAARWYASPTTLADGRIYIQGGIDGDYHPVDFPEIRGGGGSFSRLGFDTSAVSWFYPRNRIAPNGRIFGYSELAMYYVDLNGNNGLGTMTMAGTMPSAGPSGITSCDVMYLPGKILRCGGGSNVLPEGGTTDTPAINAAAVIDINGSRPAYKKQPSMPFALHWANATVLADGTVVVTGGSAVPNNLTGLNTTALLWKEGTGSWRQGAQSTPDVARLYHSVALLLPDGTLFSGGGGAPGPQVNRNAEIYYPPYLFDQSGALVTNRPAIMSAPTNILYGQSVYLGVASPSPIEKVTFIKTASVTHSCNFEQRFMTLSFTPTTGGLVIRAPADANAAPPGNYLMFVIDSSGVPSIAKIVQIS